MSQPKYLAVEYDDGRLNRIEFGKVDESLHSELAGLGLCAHRAPIGACKHYVLLQWDGWQEVVAIDSEKVELTRYYVIRRIEETGRLSFQTDSDNPELFCLQRLPRDLKRVIVAGNKGMKAYDFPPETEKWEGIFESGGKIEYTKYDKSNELGQQQGTDVLPPGIVRLQEVLLSELAKRDFRPGELLAMEESRRLQAYKEIAREMGLRAKERQRDLYGFVELLVAHLETKNG
ncbi:MAG TPA: hypothetical protein VKF36_21260 [Syntrophorhabdales bacterium]|nr:hypothetical protein [Syntrophorhabdales bacterium]